MLLVSEVEETEIFKICLEYWNHLAAELYRESPFSTSTSPLLSGNQHFDVPPRRQLYLPVLSKVPPETIYSFSFLVGQSMNAVSPSGGCYAPSPGNGDHQWIKYILRFTDCMAFLTTFKNKCMCVKCTLK